MQKTAFIAIIGKTNVGKSTLLNNLIGANISIVTPKVQTTRTSLKGIVIYNSTQIIFIDTPGIFDAKTKLERSMIRAAWSSISGVDFVLFVISALDELNKEQKNILNQIKEHSVKIICLINKIDLVKEEKLQTLKKELQELDIIEKIIEISALKNKNLEQVCDYIDIQARVRPWEYAEDELTTAPERFIASEIVRKYLFLNLQQELPYNIHIETEKWEQFSDGSVKINQVIYVKKDSHKMIILGSKGSMIKEINQKARKEIEALLGFKVHLFLFVKIKPDWENLIEEN